MSPTASAEPKYEPAPQEGSRSEGTVRAWRVPADELALVLGRPNREMVTMRRPLEYSRLQGIELTNGETLAKAAAVEVLQIEGERAYVRGTLKDGDRIISSATHRVIAGQKVSGLMGARQ